MSEENIKIDGFVFNLISDASKRGDGITSGRLVARAQEEKLIGRGFSDFRKIDRSLQRLRKIGSIRYDIKFGWFEK